MFVFIYSLSQELAIGIPCAGADPSSEKRKKKSDSDQSGFFVFGCGSVIQYPDLFEIRYPDQYQELL